VGEAGRDGPGGGSERKGGILMADEPIIFARGAGRMPPITEYREENVVWGSDSVPVPAPGVMQVYVKDGVPLMVDFLCPCGCGSTCPTPLVCPDSVRRHREHEWNYSSGPTLTPSIRYLSGCKAHFNITSGKVTLHADSGK
jgi:Family of unknown function (DUF6527)